MNHVSANKNKNTSTQISVFSPKREAPFLLKAYFLCHGQVIMQSSTSHPDNPDTVRPVLGSLHGL